VLNCVLYNVEKTKLEQYESLWMSEDRIDKTTRIPTDCPDYVQVICNQVWG